MTNFVQENREAILTVIITLTIVVLALCIAAKLFKAAVGLIILSIAVPILFAIFWGDGSEYIMRFAAIFNERDRQQIEEAYEYFRDKESSDPLIDVEKATEYITDVFSGTEKFVRNELDFGTDISRQALEHFREHTTGMETVSSTRLQNGPEPGLLPHLS